MKEFTFHTNQFNRIFPFYFLLSQELELKEAGPSLRKLLAAVDGTSFDSLFEMVRPRIERVTYQHLQEYVNQLLVLRIKQPGGVLLRGQLEVVENGSLLFLGSPWFGSMDDVKANQLSLDDFAFHDPMIDLLHVVRTQEIATSEVKELYNRLKEQSQELKKLAEERANIALFPIQNPDPVFRIDTAGNLLMKNPATDALFRNDLLIGDTSYDLVSFCRHLAQQFDPEQERLVQEARADDRYFSFSCIILRKEQYINVYGRDISALKQLELHLTRTATRFTHLIANMQAGVLMEDENRTIALTNQHFCDLFSIPVAPELLIGSDCSQAAHQFKHLFHEPVQFVERIEELLHNRALALGDRLELNDGRVFRRDFVPIWNGAFYLGHLWVYDDITTETRNKEALEEQRSFYEGILNNIPADVAVFDPEQHYLFLNPAAVKDPELRQWLIGKKDEDYALLRNRPLSRYEDRKQFFEKLRQTLTLQSFEEAVQKPDGTTVHHLRKYFPVVSAEGQLQMVIGYGIDITDRKQIEEALQVARRKTEEEAAQKERFFAALSHEIRTPLNGVLGLNELLSQTPLTNEQETLNNMLRTSGNQLLRIVNQVLDFEKIVNGKVVFEKMPFDLVKQLKEAADIFRVKGGNYLLVFNSSHPSFYVEGDPFRLDQVINNLLGNADKFTREGTVQLDVHIEVTDRHIANITLRVTDTGIGIEPEALSSIFLPYMQARNNITRQYGGTGLGLTITKQLIELQGGTISVTSKPGEGSQFVVQLQLPVATPARIQAEPADEKQAAIDFSSLRVLVAEDAEINRFLIRTMLESKGCTCRLVVNGAEACRAVQEEPFDLVLMDVEMPEMDGVEATRCIRSLPGALSQLPVIAVTANAMKGSREMYLEAGMNDYLTKPFRQNKLEEVIVRTLKQVPALPKGSDAAGQHPFDLSYLEGLSEDPLFTTHIIRLFLEIVPGQVHEIRKGVDDNDTPLVSGLLHQLRPSLETVGAAGLAGSCLEIEKGLKEGDSPQSLAASIAKLLEEVRMLLQALQGYVQPEPAGKAGRPVAGNSY